MTVHPFIDRIAGLADARPYGVLRKVAQGHYEATGPDCTQGDICEIEAGQDRTLLAEVAMADENGLVLVPLEQAIPVRPRTRVFRSTLGARTPVGDGFAGRAVDALGRPIDGGPPVETFEHAPLAGEVLRPLDRTVPKKVVHTGIRAIDGLLTLGEGQRIGIFAASGVGKTSLVEQLVAQVACDRVVLCLVGERGKEVEAIWKALGTRKDAKRFTLVAATSDQSAPLRARSTSVALALAEHWRARGEHVLLVIDSVTRLAMALREIGLAAGEPPTVRAYTPNVFAALPRLVERCGAARDGGAITAVMTVLSETDDVDDPIVEIMKSLLDGHIVLSRTLAERGHFPAIDLSRSISRQASRLMDDDHAKAARRAVALLGVYEEARVLIESGMYKSGASTDIDATIAVRTGMTTFLCQGQNEQVAFADAVLSLNQAIGSAHG